MKKKILAVLTLVFVLAGCGVSAKEYGNELQATADEILDNSDEVGNILNMYSTVWSYSIQSKGAIPVEEMMQVTGFDEETVRENFEINVADNIPNDFSINIHSLVAYYESTGKLKEIEEKSNEIKEQISDLNNPKDEFESAYSELLDMYDLSKQYINMATDPNGSLQDFNTNKNELSNNILSKYNRLEVVMPSN